jgi:hypothetical protein
VLFKLAQPQPDSTFYVFPFYVTLPKLQQDVPRLAQDTWLLDINSMPTNQIFNGRKSATVRCETGFAQINPEYKLSRLLDTRRLAGIPVQEFAEWYRNFRELDRESITRRNSWLARGLRIAVVAP